MQLAVAVGDETQEAVAFGVDEAIGVAMFVEMQVARRGAVLPRARWRR